MFSKKVIVGLIFALSIIGTSCNVDKSMELEDVDESWSYVIGIVVHDKTSDSVIDIIKVRSLKLTPEDSESVYYYELLSEDKVEIQQMRSKTYVTEWSVQDSVASFRLGYIIGGVTGGSDYIYPYSLTSKNVDILKAVYNKMKGQN